MTYSDAVVRKLNALTSEFYAREAASFSATRQSPWHGWEQAWNILATEDPALAGRALTVLDTGCGNLRFEKFLVSKTHEPLSVYAFDNCPELLGDAPAGTLVDFRPLDIVEAQMDGTFERQMPRNACDLAVAFGLMHHLPTFTLRARMLQGLLEATRPGGFAVASFWQFMGDDRLAAKAEAATAQGRAQLGLPPFAPGDYLLGWQQSSDAFRFCHHTTDGEIDALLRALSMPCREIARFSADGKTDDLNRYIVLQRL